MIRVRGQLDPKDAVKPDDGASSNDEASIT